jgi:hypothetical protein
MKRTLLIILYAALTVSYSNVLYAEDIATHNAYKITSYNLGTALELQKNKDIHTARNYHPLLITSTKADILNSEYDQSSSWGGETTPHITSTKGIALSAQYNATEKIALLGAFGLTRNLWTPDIIDYESESGWEANLGVIYKLLNNLAYEVHFAYMDTGDLFTERNSYNDVESIIMVSNRLTMSF